jgi:hypothetical protein
LYEEHIFYENEQIKISSTRISLENKTLAMKSVCSVELDIEEIQPPYFFLGFGFITFLSSFIANNDSRGTLFGLGIVIIFFALVTYIFKLAKREVSILIDLESGETEILTKEDLQENELELIFKAINDAIIFRG